MKDKSNCGCLNLSLCTDNAMMIAGLAYHKREKAGASIETVKANAGISNHPLVGEPCRARAKN